MRSWRAARSLLVPALARNCAKLIRLWRCNYENSCTTSTCRCKGPNGGVDEEIFLGEYVRRIEKRNKRIRNGARATQRAMTGRDTVKTEEEWGNRMEQAGKNFLEGQFLIDQLGAKVHVDPTLTAVILRLRSELIYEHNATNAAELMIIDSAVLSYYHLLRVTGWMGNLEQELESEFFGRRPLSAT